MACPGVHAYFEIRIDGKRVGRKRLSRSFVQGFMRCLALQMANANVGSQNDTAGVSRTLNSTNSSSFQGLGAIDTDTSGIVVGTGTTAIATTDTALVTKITTGNGAGQLRYLAQSYQTLSVGSTTVTLTFTRTFINNSGGSITVNEIGVYGTAQTFNFCFIRDVTAGIAVAAGKTLTITYTISAAL